MAFATHASDDRFQRYTDGVMPSPRSGAPCNHYVFSVGYRTDDMGKRIFLCRNSWGTGWGMDGTFEASEGLICSSDGIYVMAVRKV